MPTKVSSGFNNNVSQRLHLCRACFNPKLLRPKFTCNGKKRSTSHTLNEAKLHCKRSNPVQNCHLFSCILKQNLHVLRHMLSLHKYTCNVLSYTQKRWCPGKYHFHHQSETEGTLSLLPPHADYTRGSEGSPRAACSSSAAVSRHGSSLQQTCAPRELSVPFSWSTRQQSMGPAADCWAETIHHVRYSRDKNVVIY